MWWLVSSFLCLLSAYGYLWYKYTVQIVHTLVAAHSKNSFSNTPEHNTPIIVPIQGKLPSWAACVLYRIGPGKYRLANHVVHHAFDGMPFMHRVELDPEQNIVKYNSRHLARAVEASIRKTGHMPVMFGHQAEQGIAAILRRFYEIVICKPGMSDPSAQMVGVTASPNYPGTTAQRPLVAKTDLNMLQQIDPDTLGKTWIRTCWISFEILRELRASQTVPVFPVGSQIKGSHFCCTSPVRS